MVADLPANRAIGREEPDRLGDATRLIFDVFVLRSPLLVCLTDVVRRRGHN